MGRIHKISQNTLIEHKKLSPELPVRRSWQTIVFIFLVALIFLTMTGMAWTDHSQVSVASSLYQQDEVDETMTPTPTATPIPVVPGQPGEMIGVILAGTVLVLVVLGGTIGATRRHKS
jgi:hypothetical protein